MTSEINFESKNEFKKLAQAKEYSKYLQRPGDLKFLSFGGQLQGVLYYWRINIRVGSEELTLKRQKID